MDIIENLENLAKARIDREALAKHTGQALKRALAQGDGMTARSILEWASEHFDRHALTDGVDYIWRQQSGIDFAKGNLERITGTFNTIDGVEKSDSHSQPHSIFSKNTNRAPPFIRDNINYLENSNSNYKKIALVMNKNAIRNEKGALVESQSEDVTRNLTSTALRTGREIQLFDSARFSYDHGNHIGLEHLPDVDDVLNGVEDFGPDLVIIDGNYVPDGFGLTPERLSSLRQRARAKMVAVVGDNHGLRGEKNCRYWSEQVDLVLSFEPSTKYEDDLQEKIRLIFIPMEDFINISEPKKRIIFYSGTARGDRIAYVSALKLNNIPLFYNFGSRNSDNSYDFARYARKLAASRIVINSGRRAPFTIGRYLPTNIVTGRAFEVMSVGSLLLECAGSRLSDFFNPGEHYYEFDSLNDLVEKSRILLEDEKVCQEIAQNGQNFFNKYYNGKSFWNLLANFLDE